MSALSSLLVGVRPLRASLTAGLAWLVALFIWFGGSIPTDSDGRVGDLERLVDALGGNWFPVAVAASYLLGQVSSVPGDAVGRQFQRIGVWLFNRKPTLFGRYRVALTNEINATIYDAESYGISVHTLFGPSGLHFVRIGSDDSTQEIVRSGVGDEASDEEASDQLAELTGGIDTSELLMRQEWRLANEITSRQFDVRLASADRSLFNDVDRLYGNFEFSQQLLLPGAAVALSMLWLNLSWFVRVSLAVGILFAVSTMYYRGLRERQTGNDWVAETVARNNISWDVQTTYALD